MNSDLITDYLTGRQIPDSGAEKNRQKFLSLMVEDRGYAKSDLVTGLGFSFTDEGIEYSARIDVAVVIDEKVLMAVKCAAGSLGSREREIVSGARLANPEYQIPVAVVTDGAAVIVLDTVTGKKTGEAVPSRAELAEEYNNAKLIPYPDSKLKKERMIFKSYDSMNVNVI